jgi:hypothetical protein
MTTPVLTRPTRSIPGAPTGLSVGRTTTTPQTVRVAWKPVPDTDHYDVRVLSGAIERVYTVPGDRSSFDLTGDDRSDYQISVSARNAAGVGGSTRQVLERSLVPGPVSRLDGARFGDCTSASVSWQRVGWHGYQLSQPGAVAQPNALGAGLVYRADLVRRWDNRVLDRRTAAATWVGSRLVWVYSAHFAGLDRDVDYVVRVCAVSAWFGAGNAGEVLLERVTS